MSTRLACIDCAASPHVMHALSGTLETCACALVTCVPSCTGRIDRLFFIIEACGRQGATGHVAAPKPTSAGRHGPES
jgi:hypothetical protein